LLPPHSFPFFFFLPSPLHTLSLNYCIIASSIISMSLILLKRICPFCPRSTSFSSNQKLREHVAKTHNNILPSRTFKQQNRSNTKNYTESLRKEHPTATIKFTCPSCLNHYSTKPALKTHIEEHITSL
jgi:hypothetical protein